MSHKRLIRSLTRPAEQALCGWLAHGHHSLGDWLGCLGDSRPPELTHRCVLGWECQANLVSTGQVEINNRMAFRSLRHRAGTIELVAVVRVGDLFCFCSIGKASDVFLFPVP